MTSQYYINKLEKEGKINIVGTTAGRMVFDLAKFQGIDFGWEYDSINGWKFWMK